MVGVAGSIRNLVGHAEQEGTSVTIAALDTRPQAGRHLRSDFGTYGGGTKCAGNRISLEEDIGCYFRARPKVIAGRGSEGLVELVGQTAVVRSDWAI